MATMTADGTINHMPRCLQAPDFGSSAVFQIEATYARLAEVLGETDTVKEAEPYWVIQVRAADDLAAARIGIHHISNWPREEDNEATLWYVTAHREDRWAAERLAEKLGEIVEFDYSS